MNRSTRRLSALLALAVGGATLSVVAGAGGAVSAPRADAQSIAAERLSDDAAGALTRRSDGGVLDFLGVPARETLDNPAVAPTNSVGTAADAHLARYGAAFGSRQPGTTLARSGDMDTLVGDVVRYQQRVGGVPVMGGEVVMSLRADRELDSVLAKTSRVRAVPDATVGESAAAATAQESFQRVAGRGTDAVSDAQGRWVVDPTLIGASGDIPVRTAWRFELTRGADERRLVLVDDQTGFVLVNNDLIGHAKRRIVCDNNSVLQNPNVAAAACTNSSANKVRGEGDPAAAYAEANTAYELGGATHDGFAAFGLADLTELIGRDIGGGVKALSQTVRWCYSGSGCPYGNAFWNGSGMYYGQDYAGADDVVGHEMAHGVTERTSNLVYWGQSGAINESLSDIFGEIIDHRNVGPGDSPTSFSMGEDLPIGAIRDAANPPAFGDPDRTGSANYVKENCPSLANCYPDGDGVHSNSGVGNKTFYLASQGGTFNGQTITGIDVGDPDLTKSGRLWLLVDQTLTSGSDYADLGVVLGQACAALQEAGVMTAANCTAVGQAALATELAATPVTNPQPADATISCPGGGVPHVLFDSETGNPAAKFTAGPLWSRNGAPQTGQVAHSGPSAWSNAEAEATGQSSLTAAAPIALPAGQAAYLHFQQWRVLDYEGSTFYDGGTVEINGTPTAAGTWVNGPAQTMGVGNPIAGQLAFGGDSRGYLASRLDLSDLAGQNVTPAFRMHTDPSISFLGWFLDDIRVYTCDPPGSTDTLTVTPPASPVSTQYSDGVVSSFGAVSSSGSPNLTATATGLPAGLALTKSGVSGEATWTVTGSTTAPPGSYPATIEVSDGAESEDVPLTVNVTEEDGVPTYTGPTSVTAPAAGPDVASVSLSATVAQATDGSLGDLATATATFTDTTTGETLCTSSVTAGGAAGCTYLADAPRTYAVRVTLGGRYAGTTAADTTLTVALPAPPVLSVVAGTVIVKGTLLVGKTLKAKVAGWSPTDVTYTYQWLRNGKAIKKANGKKYKLTKKDEGKKLQVRVTATKTGYTSATVTSKKTKKIKE